MTSSHPYKVLVVLILMCVALISWTSGCAGLAEPPSQLSVTPSALSVSTPVGSTGAQIVTVTNVGTTAIDVSEAAISGPGFTIAGVTPPFSLAGGQSRSFSVKFLATATTSVDGSLSIVSDRKHRPIKVPLHGKGGSGKGVTAVAVSPSSASVTPGGTMQFAANIQGTTTNESVTWAASIGSISSTGLFTAPATTGSGRITATSVADPTKSGSATVTVTSTPDPAPNPTVTSVAISPTATSSLIGGTLPFTATVQGTTSNKAVTWKALLGSITSAGVYTAPAKAGTDSVTATSVADPTKSASASVTVTAAPAPPNPTVASVTVSPASTSTTTGGTLLFIATVQGTVSDKSVSWKAALGSISASGAYTAPANAGTDTVTATSNADSSKSGLATVTITAPAPSPTPTPSPSPSAACGSSGCPAFPGAQGGGAGSMGGRGGQVIEVTSLNDSGTGSLRACVEASGPRTCVFRVSGVIHPVTQIRASNPYLTIAGQTAPGGGIVYQGDLATDTGAAPAMINVATHDVIVRYMSCFVGLGPGHASGPSTGANCLLLESGSGIHDNMFDHISGAWADNKLLVTYANMGTTEPIKDFTVQWSLFYEPNSGHTVWALLDAAYAAGTSDNNDMHHNMVVAGGHRLPMANVHSGRFVNNIVYNWDYWAALTQGCTTWDFIGNKYAAGNLNAGNTMHEFNINPTQSTDSQVMDMDCTSSGSPQNYFMNNIGPHNSSVTTAANDAGQRAMTCQGSESGDGSCPAPNSFFRSTPLSTQTFPIVADPVDKLDSIVPATVGNSQGIDCNGNWYMRRNSQDARIVSQYVNHTDSGFFTGWDATHAVPSIAAGTACVSTLHDGIPDQWKALKGLSLSDPNLYKTTAPNGYTYLENYLNGLGQ